MPATYFRMLDECEAVVSVDNDSARQKVLEQELVELTSKLKVGTAISLKRILRLNSTLCM